MQHDYDDDDYYDDDYYEQDEEEGELMTEEELHTWLHALDKDKGYANTSMTYNWFWFVVKTQSLFAKFDQQACCGFMGGFLLREMYLSVPSTFKNPINPQKWKYPEDYKPKVLAYWKWLTSDTSPFKELSSHTYTYTTEEGISAFGFKELEKVNAQFFINYVIALRAGIERIYTVEMWYDMVENGIDPTLAYYLCITFIKKQVADKLVYLHQWDPSGHNQFNKDAVFKRLLQGPSTRKDTYNTNGNYTPCNGIWDDHKGVNYYSIDRIVQEASKAKVKTRYGEVVRDFTKDEFYALIKEIGTRV